VGARGGGPAGFAAAAAAAGGGRKVRLVERYGFLGGMGTAAGVTNFCGLHANVHGDIRPVVHGIADELLDRIDRLGGLNAPHLVFGKIKAQAYDTAAYKCAADDLLLAKGVEILFHALGAGVLMGGLDYERAVVAAGPLGIMQAALDVVLPYVRERKQFGKAIGSFQLMQAKVADMYVALNSARTYVYAVARACDAGKTTRYDAAGAILLASENAVKVSLEAVQALGGAGYTKEWPVERLVRDAKLYDIGAGTNEIRRFLIGRELLGS